MFKVIPDVLSEVKQLNKQKNPGFKPLQDWLQVPRANLT